MPKHNNFFHPPSNEIERLEMLCQIYEENMNNMLLGDYIYEVDPDDPIGGYREVREKLKLEDLPINKQKDYTNYKSKRINTHKRLVLRYAENAMIIQSIDHLFDAIVLGDTSLFNQKIPIEVDCFNGNFYIAMTHVLNGNQGKDAVTLFKQISRSDKANYPRSQFMLGLIYDLGLSIVQDDKLAKKHFKNAKKKGIDVSEYYSPTPSCFSSCLLN